VLSNTFRRFFSVNQNNVFLRVERSLHNSFHWDILFEKNFAEENILICSFKMLWGGLTWKACFFFFLTNLSLDRVFMMNVVIFIFVILGHWTSIFVNLCEVSYKFYIKWPSTLHYFLKMRLIYYAHWRYDNCKAAPSIIDFFSL